jgi:hypothetical protein
MLHRVVVYLASDTIKRCIGIRRLFQRFSRDMSGKSKSLFWRNHREVLTLQGLSPARSWRPGRDNAVIPVYKKCGVGLCTGNIEASHAPPPPTGAGMVQEEQSYLQK